MNVLVTGGTGFIGSHTCVELLKNDNKIVIVDNLINSEAETVERIQQITEKNVIFYQADLLDEITIESIFKKHSFDAVMHFAGLKAVGESVEKPLQYYHNNLAGTLNLLRVMNRFGCKKFIFSSSATVYGLDNTPPFKEEFSVSATNPYGYSKLMIEQFLADICAADPEWSTVALRYFNPIGAHDSGLIGENPNGIPNNLVPYIAKVALGELPYLQVFGNDYDTPDGTGVRDYIHVMDLAEGHISALNYAMIHTGAEMINLGCGQGYSVLEVLDTYSKICGCRLPYEIKPRRAGDVAVSYASTEKAKKLLGWKAHRTIEEMCRDSWRFVSKE